MIDNFKLYSQCYDLLYSEKNYKTEVSYVIKKLSDFYFSNNLILNLGSGTGRHDEVFREMGFQTLGIELSNEMVQIARSKGLDCIVGNISDFRVDKKFDTILSLFHVVSYLNSNDEISNLFHCVYDHLNQDGVFMFDVWYTPAVHRQIPEQRIKQCENDSLKIHRLATPTVDYFTNTVKIKYDIKVFDKVLKKETLFSEIHSMRHFSVPELSYLAELNGLELLNCEEFLTSNPLSDQTWGACFIFKKNGK
jgi:SAM-dependent methyltransferase